MVITIKPLNYNEFSWRIYKHPDNTYKRDLSKSASIIAKFFDDKYILHIVDLQNTYRVQSLEDHNVLNGYSGNVNPFLAATAIDQTFSSLLRNEILEGFIEHDDWEIEIEIDTIYLRRYEYIKDLWCHTVDVDWKIAPLNKSYKLYNLRAVLRGQLSYIFRFLWLILVASSKNEYFINAEFAAKLAKWLWSIKPSFRLYKFIGYSNLIHAIAKNLNGMGINRYQFCGTSVHDDRIKFVLDNINYDKQIGVIDWGCGEGRIAKAVLKYKQEILDCILVDIDENILTNAYENLINEINDHSNIVRMHLLYEKEHGNVGLNVYYDNISGRILSGPAENYILLLIETIEHMDEQEIDLLFELFKKNTKIRQLILTTPNLNFNRFIYKNFTNQYRLETHKREYTISTLTELLETKFVGFNIKILPLGDIWDNEPLTIGAIIDKN